MFICPHCGSNSISQENVDMADKSISRIDYMCLSCSWSQSSLFIMHNQLLASYRTIAKSFNSVNSY